MRITFNKGIAGKWDGDVNLTDHKFGRNWWFWFPRLHWNGGVPWKRHVVDVTLNWLCFRAGFTIWPSPGDSYKEGCGIKLKNN